jgi:putative transposase
MPTQPTAPHQRSRYRWNVPGGAYLITTVTRDRQPVFADDANVRLLLATIHQAKSLYPFAMLGYVVMPEHMHLLIRLGEATRIDKLMQSIKWNYTRSHKLAHGLAASQSLWQPGYWDRLIRAEDDLDRCLAYVHFNPVKHGLCVDARTYRYSSLAEYLRRGWYGDVDWGAVQSPKMSVGEPE